MKTLSWPTLSPAIESDYLRSATEKLNLTKSKLKHTTVIVNALIAIIFMTTATHTRCQTNTDNRLKLIEEKVAKLEEPQRRLVVVNDEIDYLYDIHYPRDGDDPEKIQARYKKLATDIIAKKTKSTANETIELPLTQKALETNKTNLDIDINNLFEELKITVEKLSAIKKDIAKLGQFNAIDPARYTELSPDAQKTYNNQKALDDEFKATSNKIDSIQKSHAEKTKQREKLESEILNATIKLSKLNDEKNKIREEENNVSTEEQKIRLIEWIYNLNLGNDKTDSSYYDRVKLIYNKMDFVNYDRERVRYGLSIGNTLDSLSLLYASINIKAYVSPHQFVPGHWDGESILRRSSIFFGVGSVISQPNSVDKTGTVYTIGLGFDVNPDFTVGIGYSIFDITQDDQTNKRNKGFSVNLLLSPAVFTRLFGGKD